MDIPQGVESTTVSEILDLATWQRERSSEELHSFLERRHQELSKIEDLELAEDF